MKAAEEGAKATPHQHPVTTTHTGERNDDARLNNVVEENTAGDFRSKAGSSARDSKRSRTSDEREPSGGTNSRTRKDGTAERAAAPTAVRGRGTGRGKKHEGSTEASEAHEPSGPRSQGIGLDEGKQREEAQPQADGVRGGGGGIGDELARALRPTDELEKVSQQV